MSNSIVLRKVYALDSNTNQFLSSGQVLLTNTLGGTTWTNILSTLIIAGGNTVGVLPCTISSVSTIGYVNTSTVLSFSSIFTPAICSMSTALATQLPGQITQANLVSSVAGLGTIGYISSSALQSTISSTQNALQSSISSTQAYSPPTASTMSTIATTLATYGYLSTAQLVSTVVGLGTSTYVSTPSLVSSVRGLGVSGYISTPQLVSTVSSLVGGGISTVAFTSTFAGLGTGGYISTATLTSSLVSTVTGLGSASYVSSSQLISTTQALSSQKANIRFDNTTSVTVIDSVNTFNTTANVIYVSTFFTSSLYYSGNNRVQFTAQNPVTHDIKFSTAAISLAPFSSFIDSSSRVTIDIFPQIAFSKLATGANNVAVLPISSFLQYSNTNIYTTTVQNYVMVNNTYMIQSNGGVITYTDSSNFFNSPIRIAIPPGTIGTNYTQTYNLVHYMPSSLNNGAYQNALHNCNVTPYFGSTGSIFVSVQNIV
jgi:hypothetical protein